VNHLIHPIHRRQVLIQHGAQFGRDRAGDAHRDARAAGQDQRLHPVFVNGFTNGLNLLLGRFTLHHNHHTLTLP
jgi:hypothetical protein